MSNLSDSKGRANEYAYIKVFEKEISKVRKTSVVENEYFYKAKSHWDDLTIEEKSNFTQAAEAAYRIISRCEPLLIEKSDIPVELRFQSDKKGEEGDVRDIVISRNELSWEIGISIKHNHFAAKHSRLGPKLDFSLKWFGYKCSDEYWETVLPIFDRLQTLQKKGIKWNELADKFDSVYYPLLKAFIAEISRQYNLHGKDIPVRLIEYLFAKYDFYKSIGLDKNRLTIVQIYNFKGTLGKNSKEIRLYDVILPTRIIKLDFEPGKKHIVELYLDNGWQLSFRIHNASTIVEPSLKFDIQIVGMPSTIVTFEEYWK